ncbi:hypothetical protein NEUTE1DRAFT_118328 [Neurospora tetrasperma FGSC 2508]|uniref:Uncharacterized protein n=1 Tax=Neurospora tetrasperma (strain FGSC 2508 / ATCC MYA-4615 / P0657) TaxID=510951 RepID=F8MVZ5_NEUT8|nr:uncharacterized protein NEUTE1DRAFT_118328 [Neurospora tetrasperma FGSC 2508]EGO54843.1 hypothetical protein NEUTE1DRAFT_118328 [Neurospora tetrasperma FGSC 2508]EGZ67668.1 hypothetical protein NEUTE2DRAFT_145705 [Neurospora tetrasperma FGSC 2509]
MHIIGQYPYRLCLIALEVKNQCPESIRYVLLYCQCKFALPRCCHERQRASREAGCIQNGLKGKLKSAKMKQSVNVADN